MPFIGVVFLDAGTHTSCILNCIHRNYWHYLPRRSLPPERLVEHPEISSRFVPDPRTLSHPRLIQSAFSDIDRSAMFVQCLFALAPYAPSGGSRPVITLPRQWPPQTPCRKSRLLPPLVRVSIGFDMITTWLPHSRHRRADRGPYAPTVTSYGRSRR